MHLLFSSQWSSQSLNLSIGSNLSGCLFLNEAHGIRLFLYCYYEKPFCFNAHAIFPLFWQDNDHQLRLIAGIMRHLLMLKTHTDDKTEEAHRYFHTRRLTAESSSLCILGLCLLYLLQNLYSSEPESKRNASECEWWDVFSKWLMTHPFAPSRQLNAFWNSHPFIWAWLIVSAVVPSPALSHFRNATLSQCILQHSEMTNSMLPL